MRNDVIGIAQQGAGQLKIHRFRLRVHLGHWLSTCGNKAARTVEPMREGTVCRSCFKHGKLPIAAAPGSAEGGDRG